MNPPTISVSNIQYNQSPKSKAGKFGRFCHVWKYNGSSTACPILYRAAGHRQMEGGQVTDASQDRALGRLEGKIDLIIAEQEKAATARRAQCEKLDALDRKVDATETKVESIDRRLEKVEEPVAEFSRWRERGVGAVMLISFAAASLGGLLATFGKKLWSLLTGG